MRFFKCSFILSLNLLNSVSTKDNELLVPEFILKYIWKYMLLKYIQKLVFKYIFNWYFYLWIIKTVIRIKSNCQCALGNFFFMMEILIKVSLDEKKINWRMMYTWTMIKMIAKLMMIKIKWIHLQMHREYIPKHLIYLLLIFRICLLIPVFIVAFMMLKMLFSAKAKIVINGFAMEKDML